MVPYPADIPYQALMLPVTIMAFLAIGKMVGEPGGLSTAMNTEQAPSQAHWPMNGTHVAVEYDGETVKYFVDDKPITAYHYHASPTDSKGD